MTYSRGIGPPAQGTSAESAEQEAAGGQPGERPVVPTDAAPSTRQPSGLRGLPKSGLPCTCGEGKVCSNSRLKGYFREGKGHGCIGPDRHRRLVEVHGHEHRNDSLLRARRLATHSRPQFGRLPSVWLRSPQAPHLHPPCPRARVLHRGGVRTLLRLADERKRPCADVRAVADAHLKDVRAKIADLRRMERVLKATVARCTAGKRSDCPLIEALYQNGSTLDLHGSRGGPDQSPRP
jgi:MerR, DNA binding